MTFAERIVWSANTVKDMKLVVTLNAGLVFEHPTSWIPILRWSYNTAISGVEYVSRVTFLALSKFMVEESAKSADELANAISV